MSVLLVQGFFFQNEQWLDIRHKPIDGAVVVVCEGLTRSMFSGVFQSDPTKALDGLYVGAMEDRCGQSVISDGFFEPDRSFQFKKQYDGRDDVIDYAFKWNDKLKLYAGRFAGEAVGCGLATCVVTVLENPAFDVQTIQEIVGLSFAHKWPSEP